MNYSFLKNRAFFALALIPAILLALHFFSKMQELDFLEERFHFLQKKFSLLNKDSGSHDIVISDHFYIDKHLESLLFLEPEIKNLQALDLQNAASKEEQERLLFLKNSNRLLFSEENVQRNTTHQEMFERQKEPIEINEEDLKKLLSRIEGVVIESNSPLSGRPHLLIQNMTLSKKAILPDQNVYTVNMQLIKREPINE